VIFSYLYYHLNKIRLSEYLDKKLEREELAKSKDEQNRKV
jgi:hypothetical protein